MAFRSLVAGVLAGVLVASSPVAFGQASSPKLKTLVYAVADLVIPLPDIAVTPQTTGKAAPATTETKLISLVESTVSPQSWNHAGGPGTIEYFPLTMSLVISQTPEVQEQVQDLLASLRRAQDTEVVVEVRFLTVSTEFFERLGLDVELYGKNSTGVTMLDDSQVRVLLEATQGDQRANVMQAPKLTMFNGQRANIDVTEHAMLVVGVEVENKDGKQVQKPVIKKVKTGLEVSMLPTVSPDNKNVTLQFAVHDSWAEPAPPGSCSNQPHYRSAKLEKKLKLTDQTTAMMTFRTRWVEARSEYGPPILSKIPYPYINQLYKNVAVAMELEHTFVLVTPRIIVREEPRQTGFTAEQEVAKPPVAAMPAKAEAEVMYVNKKAFDLSYELANVGPSKVESLAVWVTRDGEKWERYPDAVKPTGAVPITVKGDGIYGFTLVPRNGAGVEGSTPRVGDKPQVVVAVHTVLPTVMVFSPRVEPDGTVVIDYKAPDNNHILRDKPVSVYWSERPTGPWHPIEENVDATGKVAAKPGSLPYRCYLRATAVDVAGNVGETITPEPVVTDTKVPTVTNVKIKVGK